MVSERRRLQLCAASKKWRDTHPKHGLMPQQRTEKLAAQRNLCALCGEPFGTTKMTKPHLDHSHVTNKARGYIHGECNVALGIFNDNPELFRKAAAYLERHLTEELWKS